MKFIRKHPLVFVLVLANLLVLAFYGQQRFVKARHKKAKQAKVTLETASRFDKAKFMRQDDYLHLNRIEKPMHDTGTVSDEDLQWCLNQLQTNPNPTSPNGKLPMQLMVTGPLFMYVKRYTPHQKDMLFAYSTQALTGDGGGGGQ